MPRQSVLSPPSKKRKTCDPNQMKKAIEAVRTKVMGYKKAVKIFSVPRPTLKRLCDLWAHTACAGPEGEPQKKMSDTIKTTMTDYDKLVDLFYKRLTEQRQYNQEMKEQDRRWSMQKVVQRFPGWNEVTIANLHSLFLLFDNQSNGMLGFDDFCAVLESLGDETSMETRKEKYNSADSDNDGWITYDEFLSLVYKFNPPEEGQPSGLALLCNEVADNIQFVSNLTVGEQLEYGLF